MSKTEGEIHTLAEFFVRTILENEDPGGLCFTVCYSLFLYLNNNGIKTLIKSGVVNENTPHYLLTLQDNENIVVDPTIQQFDKDKPIVFIGKKPDNYGDFELFDLTDVYERWLYPLVNDGLLKPLSRMKVQEPKFIDIRRLLNVNIRAAALLSPERAQMNLKSNNSNSGMNRLYFAAIDKMVLANRLNKKLLNKSLHDVFDELILIAEQHRIVEVQ